MHENLYDGSAKGVCARKIEKDQALKRKEVDMKMKVTTQDEN